MNKYMIVYHDGSYSIHTHIIESESVDTIIKDVFEKNTYQFFFEFFEHYLNAVTGEDDSQEDEINEALNEADGQEDVRILQKYINTDLKKILNTIHQHGDDREDPHYSVFQFNETTQQFEYIF